MRKLARNRIARVIFSHPWRGVGFASGGQEDAARFEREADAMEARQRIAAAKARGAESFAKAKAAEEEDNPAAEEEAKKDA